MGILPRDCIYIVYRFLRFTFIYDIDIARIPNVLKFMSHIALNRGLQVLRHLIENRSARFKDIAKILDPVSPASQMRLLRTLTELGEIEKEGNLYRLSSSSIFRMATSPHPFALRREINNT